MANNQIALLAKTADFGSTAEREGRDLQLQALRDAAKVREQGMADDLAVRDVYKNNADPQARLKALYGVNPKAAMAAEKFDVDLGKDRAETADKASSTKSRDLETNIKKMTQAGQAMGYVMKNPTLDVANRTLDELERAGIYSSEAVAHYKAEIAKDPSQIAALAEQGYRGAMSTKDQLAKLDTRNLGGTIQNTSTDPVTGAVRVTDTSTITQSPDSRASIAQQERNSLRVDARSRESNDRQRLEPRGQVVQTDEGMMLVDPRGGTARPVIGADGVPVAPKMKQLPAPIQKALLENDAALRKVSSALEEVAAYPEAFGVKNYLGDGIRQRSDPQGIKARALVADIGSLKIHDRSGAAVTASETPRLKPFIPAATDEAATIKKKLELFQKEYDEIQTDINNTYTREQGYRAPAAAKGGASGDWGGAAPPKAATRAQAPRAGTVQDGYRFKGGDPAKQENWERM